MILLASTTRNIWEIIIAISTFVMAVAALFAVISYYTGRRSQYLSTIESCSEEFRKYMRSIQGGKAPKTIKRDMLGLFHKQLFYIENNYVPLNIKMEWLKTMYMILQDNLLAEKVYKKSGFKKKFKPKNWKKSFVRVRIFMDSHGATGDFRSFIKPHKRRYFTRAQRIILTWRCIRGKDSC